MSIARLATVSSAVNRASCVVSSGGIPSSAFISSRERYSGSVGSDIGEHPFNDLVKRVRKYQEHGARLIQIFPHRPTTIGPAMYFLVGSAAGLARRGGRRYFRR